MIIFIGGPTHTGKTILAQRLMERLRVPYLSEDHLKMGLFRGWPGCGMYPEGQQEAVGAYESVIEQREEDDPDPVELIQESETCGRNVSRKALTFSISAGTTNRSCLMSSPGSARKFPNRRHNFSENTCFFSPDGL